MTTTSDELYPATPGDDRAPASATAPLVLVAAVGGAVALSLGTYAQVHQPTGAGIATFGFPAVLPMKAWFTTGALALGGGQAITALWMWGRLPGAGSAPGWVSTAHRWGGTLAFLLTLPVAYHCLWSLGFQTTTPRVLVHSLLGCTFYGVFAAKMLGLRSQRLPTWAVPVLGGGLVTVLTGLWLTSSLWFFTQQGFPGV
jgi:hypothetical protein